MPDSMDVREPHTDPLYSLDPGMLFPGLHLGVYRLVFLVTGGQIPRHLTGSTWRGVFGRMLRAASCPWKKKHDCRLCPVSARCLYYCLYEQESSIPRFSKPPRPYIIRAVNNPGRQRRLEVEVVLINLGDDQVVRVLTVFGRTSGIGQGRNRAHLRLEVLRQMQVDGSWRTIFSGGRHHSMSSATHLLKDYLDQEPALPAAPWVVRRLTPLRLRKQERLQHRIDWSWVFGLFARRLAMLSEPGTGAILSDSRERELSLFFSECGEIIDADYWQDMHRYSSPQGKKVPIGGLQGVSLVLPPPGREQLWYRWWRSASLLHLGKGTSLGHGKIEIRGHARSAHKSEQDG